MLHQSASNLPDGSPLSNARSANPSGLSGHVSARLRARTQQCLTSPIKADLHNAAIDSASDARTNSDMVHQLAREVRALETVGRKSPTNSTSISSGCQAMDRCLPDGGYVPGSVIEYLRAMAGCGASTLAFTAAASAMRATNGFIVIVDTQHNIYPPSLTSWGIDLDKLVLVRPQSDVDALWVVDQSLRTPAVAAVVADVERIDDRAARRMQLAAEQGGGLALLLRPASARRGPSWAEIQWMVRAVPTASDAQDRRLQVQLVRVRAGKAGASLQLRVSAMDGTLHEVERHESTSAMHLASQLANTTRPSRRASAG
jgi:protein ImuA